MRRVLERVLARREVYIALLELRLEATRRPALRASLTATVRARFEADVAFHEQIGAAGGRTVVELLHHALEGLFLDQLTLPDAIGSAETAGRTAELLAEAIVAHDAEKATVPAERSPERQWTSCTSQWW